MIDLKKIIEYTKINQTISWGSQLSHLNVIDPILKPYILNEIDNGNGKVHGYFTLLHNVVKELPDDAIIVELGNREGMSTLSIYDALKPNQKFYTIDILKDLRMLPKSFFNDERVNIVYGDCVSKEITSLFEDESIDLLFSDTVHFYDQINNEFNVYKSKMKHGSILFVDDIKIKDKGKFFDGWQGEKYSLDSWAHESGFGCFKISK